MDSLQFRTDKKIALVTGSGTGIGANVAIDLASNGYFIIVVGRKQDNLDSVVAKCNEITSPDSLSAVSYRADLFDLNQVDGLIQFIKMKFERLDVLVNNACWRGDRYKNLVGKSDDGLHFDNLAAFNDFEQVMHLNVSVPMYLIQRCLLMMRHGQNTDDDAVVVNISSIASQSVVPLHKYSISKSCLSEMSRQLAKLSEQIGVCFVTISPGPILTEMRPHHQSMSNMTLMDRVGTTQEVSNLVIFTIKNARLFNGQELNIDGGCLAKHRQMTSTNIKCG